MFTCDVCHKSSQPNQSCHRKVVATRPKEYEHSVTKGSEEKQFTKVYKFKGSEIVKEQKVCRACISNEVNKELLAKGKDVVNDFDMAISIVVPSKPKRKSREEDGSQFKIKLPYDILSSNFFHKLEGLEAWLHK